MEGYLAGLTGRHLDAALYDAQDVMYRAWDSTKRQTRIRLAKRALSISPLCADAYVMLAEESAKSIEKARDLYARGVGAGALALGPDAFVEDVGFFWGILETRPYMRARCGLAQALWTLGEREEAIDHYNELLRLNPNDNQGIRYLLCACLLESGDGPALETLLEAYAEDSAAYWTYTRALCAFREFGPVDHRAVERLAEARQSNAHVPAYLSGEKSLPVTSPYYISMGGEDEAAEYVRDCGRAWTDTPGAIEWLAHGAAASSHQPSASDAQHFNSIYRLR